MDKVDEMYMENLEEWILEEEKVVTYKFLSRNLKVHVNVAKQMLFNFIKTRKEKCVVVYLVSGLVENNDHDDDGVTLNTSQKVVLVKEEDLEKVKSKFKEILSQHVYSVQRSGDVSMSSLFVVDKLDQSEEVTGAAGLTAIKHKAAVPREAIIRPQKTVKKEIKTEPVKKEQPKKSSAIEAAFSKSSNRKSPAKEQSSSKTSAAKTSTTSNKGKANIATMFAKQSTKPKQPAPVKTDVEEKENIVNQKIEEQAETAKKETKQVVKPASKSKKSKDDDSKKRKRIQVMSDSEEEDNDDHDEVEEKPVVEEDAPPVTALIESDDEEEIPATPVRDQTNTKTGRRRVKKLVEKTFMDKKGYMVTKKEYQSASETDEEPEPVKKTTPKIVEKVGQRKINFWRLKLLNSRLNLRQRNPS